MENILLSREMAENLRKMWIAIDESNALLNESVDVLNEITTVTGGIK